MISRRKILSMAGATPAWFALKESATRSDAPRMGGTPTAFSQASRAAKAAGRSFDIVEHCHSIGLAGVQTNPPTTNPEAIRKFRQRLESYGMHLICSPQLPKQESDLEAFEIQVKAYKEAGAAAFHAAMTGRRYEDYDSLEPFRRMFEQSRKSVALAEPVLRKYRIRLGIENHKGWRSAEQVTWLNRLSSEWVGVCLDVGNNIALCEEPMDTLQRLAPHALFVHLKDVAVEEYQDGFLLSEVPFGEGLLDLGRIVRTLRAKDPNMIFNLEMITRDPLQIPVFTSRYWATFDDSYSPLPGRDLAKVLAMVKRNRLKAPLQRISGLDSAAMAKAENENNLKCISYARQNLNL